jgi:hypothetical protein
MSGNGWPIDARDRNAGC